MADPGLTPLAISGVGIACPCRGLPCTGALTLSPHVWAEIVPSLVPHSLQQHWHPIDAGVWCVQAQV